MSEHIPADPLGDPANATPEAICDALHAEEEGHETQEIPTRDLLAITSLLTVHPDWWEWPCFCAECRSYADG